MDNILSLFNALLQGEFVLFSIIITIFIFVYQYIEKESLLFENLKLNLFKSVLPLLISLLIIILFMLFLPQLYKFKLLYILIVILTSAAILTYFTINNTLSLTVKTINIIKKRKQLIEYLYKIPKLINQYIKKSFFEKKIDTQNELYTEETIQDLKDIFKSIQNIDNEGYSKQSKKLKLGCELEKLLNEKHPEIYKEINIYIVEQFSGDKRLPIFNIINSIFKELLVNLRDSKALGEKPLGGELTKFIEKTVRDFGSKKSNSK
jgi:hypothetical protein